MNRRLREQAIFTAVVLILISFLGISLSSARAADVLFEIHGATQSSGTWGRHTFTTVDKIAQKYTPLTAQTVCSVKHQVMTSGNPTDDIVLTIYSGGSIPEIGYNEASVAVNGSTLPKTGTMEYVSFKLDPCLNLNTGVTYWFVWTRSSILPNLINGYNSYYRTSDEYANSSFWAYPWSFDYFFSWGEIPNQEWSLLLEGPETPPAKEPVIIVPGILGTRLNRISDGVEVWPDMYNMFQPGPDNYLSQLILGDSGNQITGKEMIASSVIDNLGINTGPFIVYGKFVDYFRNLGYIDNTDLFVFPYDWRLNIDDSVSVLNSTIQKAIANSPTGKVNIIAHSMGGLLVKKYLSEKTDTNFLNKTILIGVPQLGSPKAFKALNWGDDFGFNILGLGLNQTKAKEIGQNMPAVYELLPSQKYFQQNGGGYVQDFRNGNKILNFDETNQFLTSDKDLPDHRNGTLITTADTFHQEVDDSRVNAPRIYNIADCQVPTTIGQFRIYDGGNIDITPINGDGTVPVISALGGNTYSSESYFVLGNKTNAEHLDLVKNNMVLNLISNIIADKPLSTNDGISQVIGDCFAQPTPDTKLLAISTHSPVVLHIYDSQNRHTGPNINGDIETGIPGSDYEIIGENHFAFVPAGIQYRVEIDAIATGSFNFKIKSYNGITPVDSAIFSNVPITNSNLKAQINLSDVSPDLQLNIDQNGDGTNDNVIAPSSTVSGQAVDDATPPEIELISPENKSYLRSESLPINVNIADSDSGVGLVKFKLDGVEIASNSTNIDLFYQKLGSHSFEIDAYDKAGNPATKKVDFQIDASVESAISDIERADGLGWILKKNTKRELEESLKAVVKIETRIEKIEEKLPGKPKVVKIITRLEKRIDKVLTRLLLIKLERDYTKGSINQAAYILFKEDTEWLLNN